MLSYIPKLLPVVTLVAFSSLALAGGALANDALAVTTAKIPLRQAVTTAEEHANGAASRAEFEHSKKLGAVYEVEVVNGSKVFDVVVDANKGTVISSVEDPEDSGD